MAPPGNQKKYLHIRNFGCQMNFHDAQRMAEVLFPHGYQITDDPHQAEVVLINTCSVREKSQQKVYSAIGRYGELKKENPNLLLGVAGCVAQQEGQRLLDQIPLLDLVFSPDHIAELPQLLSEARKKRNAKIGFLDESDYEFLSANPLPGVISPTAFVTIQKGCDNHCSYCIVPQVRGPEVSRPATEIVAEIRNLAAQGVKEVTVIGQNVNSYRGNRGDQNDFVQLLFQIDEIEGIERIRFTTSHPKDFSEALVDCFRDLHHLCPWLHLPVQSGSTNTLQRMHRGYSRDDYLKIIERVREVCPKISIGTDIIVGFPGEVRADFEETMSLVEYIQYDYLYSFKYSVRPGTAAEKLRDDILEDEKKLRLQQVQSLQDTITRKKLNAMVGARLPVLIEGPSRQGLPQLCGRTPGNHVVNVEVKDDRGARVGDIVQVRMIKAGGHSLTGELEEGI